MKAIIQRVKESRVTLEDGTVSGEIAHGLNVLVGIHRDDTMEDADYIARKIVSLRLFSNEEGLHWKKSVNDLGYGVLLVSQFTLYSICKREPNQTFIWQ
ncbi:hypothetical protein GEMRC1_008770 [Eukaryota sp. GEM-RC1]